MEKFNEQLARLQQQSGARKALLEQGKIRLTPERAQPQVKQKDEEDAEKQKQLSLLPSH
ncbi:MAG TPA: hypothetical protein VI750_13805 [Pyrinomonadaceae bacterium]|jgi:hypothetical protein|nr:hypothetical protein [Pyrinomonadaceae bacterium]